MGDVQNSLAAAPLLEMKRLSQRKRGRQLLKEIDLQLWPSELLLLIGPSGGGKSSLLRLLNRLDEATAGSILLQGQDTRELQPTELRQRVAMVMQKPVMFEGTVLQNLQSAFTLRHESPPPADSGLVNEILESCGLEPDLLPRDAGHLSVGQQQRVSLARSLLTAPNILLLDEPTSALDRPSADRLGEGLRRLCRERRMAVLMVSHDLRLAERIADRVAFLQAGELVEQGGVEILHQPQTGQLQQFLEDPELIRSAEERSP